MKRNIAISKLDYDLLQPSASYKISSIDSKRCPEIFLIPLFCKIYHLRRVVYIYFVTILTHMLQVYATTFVIQLNMKRWKHHRRGDSDRGELNVLLYLPHYF